MASDSGVGDRVTFTGMLEEEELRDYLACSDLYVSTSLADAGLAAGTAGSDGHGVACSADPQLGQRVLDSEGRAVPSSQMET